MKKNIKDKLLKVLHVVCYILSVLFILGCIIFGVGSCNLKNKTSSNNGNNSQAEQLNEIVRPIRKSLSYEGVNYKYVLMSRSGITTTWNYGLDTATSNAVVTFDGPNCTTIVNQWQEYSIYIHLNECVVYNSNDTYYGYNILSFKMDTDPNGSMLHLNSISLQKNGASDLSVWHWSTGYANPLTILCNDFTFTSSNINPLPNRSFDYIRFLSIFYTISESQDVIYSFNDYNINPIQYYSYEIMTDNTAHNVGSYTGHIDLNMKFVSNGMSFKKMRFQYDYVLGTYYNNELTTYDNMTYLALSYIAYQRSYDDVWVKVCYPRIYKYETRTLNDSSQLYGYPFTDFNSYLWANEGYKDIVIVEGVYNIFSNSSGDPIANLNNIQVLTYEGEMNSVGVDVSNTNNVFILLGNGFSSVTSLFGIILLPGITIGTLLFLPLVVAIVLAIIKLLRK